MINTSMTTKVFHVYYDENYKDKIMNYLKDKLPLRLEVILHDRRDEWMAIYVEVNKNGLYDLFSGYRKYLNRKKSSCIVSLINHWIEDEKD